MKGTQLLKDRGLWPLTDLEAIVLQGLIELVDLGVLKLETEGYSKEDAYPKAIDTLLSHFPQYKQFSMNLIVYGFNVVKKWRKNWKG